MFQSLRFPSDVSTKAPFRVPTSTRTLLILRSFLMAPSQTSSELSQSSIRAARDRQRLLKSCLFPERNQSRALPLISRPSPCLVRPSIFLARSARLARQPGRSRARDLLNRLIGTFWPCRRRQAHVFLPVRVIATRPAITRTDSYRFVRRSAVNRALCAGS